MIEDMLKNNLLYIRGWVSKLSGNNYYETVVKFRRGFARFEHPDLMTKAVIANICNYDGKMKGIFLKTMLGNEVRIVVR